MRTIAGTGFSEHLDAKQAGAEAARRALANAGLEQCDVVFFGATPTHDPVLLLEGIREVVGERARLLGSSAAGMITNDALGYDGYQVGVAVFVSDSVRVDFARVEGLTDAEYDCGAALGRQIRDSFRGDEAGIVFMYDAVKLTALEGGPALNLATPLLEGMKSVIEDWPSVAGMGVLGDARFIQAAHLWHGDSVGRELVQAAVFSGDMRMDTVILHGCKPAGRYMRITRAEQNIVLELDGRPALEVIDALFGPDSGVSREDYPFFLTLGVNRGDRFEEFKEEHYANRLCLALDKERGGLVMFEPDLQTGDEVQVMHRSLDFSYIGQRIDTFMQTLDGYRPFLAIYIDCLGRAAAYSGTEREEAEEVQKHLGSLPLLGFYTGVEVAKIAGHVQALDWTGVLCIFSEPDREPR